ncbi:MAG: hypothetical protein FJ398_19665 [Verrucomicrobia bacterium]|nr:hypothetical protein [Verrucomicrobiota bacterium]
MGSEPVAPQHRIPGYRKPLRLLRANLAEDQPLDANLVKEHLLAFVLKLQEKYPFRFAVAYRGLDSELNKQAQERLTTHFLFSAISEMSALDSKLKELVWLLGRLLSKQIGKGGENFRPHEFSPKERALAQEIGESSFEELIRKAEELSLAMKFKIGPVNSAEHVLAWSFRYLRQLLKAAKWESIKRGAETKPRLG